MKVNIRSVEKEYEVVLERGCLKRAGELLNLDRKVMIVTDEGVPTEYSKTLASLCKEPYIFTMGEGEGNKNLQNVEKILKQMLEHGFTRQDACVAVGGGVVGDLTGFTAASYMRGIEFYNIPTTVLSQVDSSVGGKTGVNLLNVKNVVGAFYQPGKVLIDTELLKTLEDRQIINGLSEALKMALTFDAALFERFEKGEFLTCIDEIIERSVELKKEIVEQDEKEQGLRRVLNFGHTIGHGIEVQKSEKLLYHGECVALGMIPMCSSKVKERLIPILENMGLPTAFKGNPEKIFEAITHDKKVVGNGVKAIVVEEVGTFKIVDMEFSELKEKIFEITGERA